MKKNNKFRNNGSSNAYSLNYKFDSSSPAGKVSGTALDLIKKYNELAKEAQASGDYVEMEVFRQYAEHYRKIVTEINERKNYRQEQQSVVQNQNAEMPVSADTSEIKETEEKTVEPIVQTPMPIKKKTFKIVEIKPTQDNLPVENQKTEESKEESVKPKRVVRRKKTDETQTQSEAI